MTVSVKAMNPPNVLKQGDIVIGMIRDLREKMAMVTVMKVHGNTRAIAGDTDATIQISHISKNYTESIRDEFRTGDFVRAKVVSTSPSIQLTTVDDDLGVIRAVCSFCKGPMVKNEKGLYCEDCDKTSTRKISSNYGDVRV
jgi:exosome complex component CSL4